MAFYYNDSLFQRPSATPRGVNPYAMPQPGRPPPAPYKPPGYTGPAGFATAAPSQIPGAPQVDPGETYFPAYGDPGTATPPPPGPPNLGNLDYANDPILARVRALSEEAISQAQADAQASRTRLVIGLGDPDLAAKLGLTGDVQEQARGNPFGTFQELNRQVARRNVFDINRPLSDRANLFYSTERGRQLALSGEQYLRDRSQATSAAQGSLAEISARLTQAKMAAQAQQIQAEQEAYQRALQMALYAGGG